MVTKMFMYFIIIIFILILLYFILFESFFYYSKLEITSSPLLQMEQDSNNDNNRLIKAGNNNNNSNIYSTYVCIGDIYHKKNTDRMVTCRFTNICYNGKNEHWEYFVRNNDNKQLSEIIYDNFDQLLDDFWDKFILFRHNPPTYWRPYIIKNKSIDNNNNNNTKWFNDPTVYHYPFVMNNFGHCLGDNFYTIWHTLDIFKQYNYKNMELLLHYDGMFKDKSTINNINKIYPYIMKKMPLILYKKLKNKILSTFNENINNKKYNEKLKKYDKFCFKDFYVGTTSLRLQRSATKPFEWNRFIYNQFLNNNKHYKLYNKYMMINKQKILFLNKTMGEHRRYYANNISIVCKYISNLFNVEIDILTDYDLMKMSLNEQINFIFQYSILITPCGSLAFLGVFMREGTAMITMDWFNQIFNLTSHLESYLWEFETRKKIFYYYVTEKDIIKRIDNITIKKKRISFHDIALHWSDYIIRPKRLAIYVYSALLWVENYNQWNGTFKLN